jgi:hypothetical protein
MRSSNTFHELEQKMEKAANRAAAIHAIAEARGVMIKLEFEPPIAKPLTKLEIENLSVLTNIAPEVIQDARDKADKRRYDSELEACDLAASLFWSAVADEDAPIKFDMVDKAIQRTRLNLLTWSKVDIAELADIAQDELALNDWMSTMSDDPAQYEESDEAREERENRAEIKALDAHAKAQQTIAYLDAERAKAATTAAKRRRVPKTA